MHRTSAHQSINYKDGLALFLLYFSAFLYPIPLLFPTSFWWVVFLIFPLFLQSVVLRTPTVLQGFFWGLITFICSGGFFLRGIFSLAHGSCVYRSIPLVMLTLVMASWAAVWFWCATTLSKWYMAMNRMHSITVDTIYIVIWTCTAWLYLLWIDRGCLIVCGRLEGIGINNLLVPLIEHPSLLYWVPYVGTAGGLGMLLALAGTLVTCVLACTRTSLIFLIGIIIFWLMGVVMQPQDSSDHGNLLQNSLVIPQRYQSLNAPFGTAHALLDCVRNCLHKNPELRLLVFPESAVSDLDVLPIFEQLWLQEKNVQHIHLLIGGFSADNKGYHNTIYWFYRGKLQQLIHKNHANPLTERSISNISGIRSVYFDTIPEIIPDTRRRIACLFEGFGCDAVVYICSELFFNSRPHDHYRKKLIIALCNDAWVGKIAQRQMLMQARFKAFLWQRDIMYCTYNYHALLKSSGAN